MNPAQSSPETSHASLVGGWTGSRMLKARFAWGWPAARKLTDSGEHPQIFVPSPRRPRVTKKRHTAADTVSSINIISAVGVHMPAVSVPHDISATTHVLIALVLCVCWTRHLVTITCAHPGPARGRIKMHTARRLQGCCFHPFRLPHS